MINSKAVVVDIQFDIGPASAEIKDACRLLDRLKMTSKSVGDAAAHAFMPILNSLQSIQSGVESIVAALSAAVDEVAVVNASAQANQGEWNPFNGIITGFESVVQTIDKIEEIEKSSGKIYTAWEDVVTAPNVSSLIKSMLPKTTETLGAVGAWAKNVLGKSLIKGMEKISPQVASSASDVLADITSKFSKYGSILGSMSVGWGAVIAVAIAAVIALVTLIIQNWDEIKAALGVAAEWFNTNIIQPIVGFFTGLWESITETATNIWNSVAAAWSGIAQWVDEYVIQPVVGFFTGLWTSITEIATSIWNGIAAIWSGIAQWVQDNVILPVVGFFTGLWTSITEIATNIWDGIVGIFSCIAQWVQDNVIQPIMDFIAPIVEWFSKLFASFGQTVADVLYNIVVLIKGYVQLIFTIWKTIAIWFYENVIQPVVQFFVDMWNQICTFAAEAWTGIQNAFRAAATWFDTEIIQPIVQFFTNMWNQICALAADAWMGIQNAFCAAVTWFHTDIIQPIVQFFTNMWNQICAFAADAWTGIKNVFWGAVTWFDTNVVKPVAAFFVGLWDGFTQGASDAWEAVKNVFSAVAGFFHDVFSRAWAGVVKVFDFAGDIFTNLKGGILDVFKTIVNGLIDGINAVIAVPFNGINAALGFVKDIQILGITPFADLRMISIPEIPHLAHGAVLPANKPFLAVVGDQKHGTNVEAPLATIQEAVALVMQDQFSGVMAGFEASVGVQKQILQAVLGIEIGDSTIGQAAARYNRKMAVIQGGM